MWGIQIDQHGGPEVLQWRELPEPVAGPGQVVAEVGAAGLNFIDTYQRSGLYQVTLPYVLGLEGAAQSFVPRLTALKQRAMATSAAKK